MRRFLILLLAGAVFLSLSAAAGAEKVSLQFFNIGPTKQVVDLFEKEIIPAFEQKYPGVSVTMETSDWGSAFQKVTTGIAAGTAPDVLVIGGIWVAPLASKNGLLPLDDFVELMPDREDIYAAAWDDCRYQGHLYAVPWNLDVRALVYRKDLFEEAGLDPNSPPQTWDQYLEYAKKLTKKRGNQIIQMGTEIGLDTSIGIQQYFAQLYFQAGGRYYREDGSSNFYSPEGLKAIRFLKRLVDEGVTSPAFVQQPNAAAFLTLGRSAMAFGGTAAMQNVRVYAPDLVDQIGIGRPLAMNETSEPATCVWVNKVAVYKGTKHPNEAWDFLRFITNTDNAAKWARLVGNLPARKSIAAAEPLKSDEQALSLLDAMEYAHVQPARPQMFEIPHIIKDKLMLMLYDKLSPEEALQQMHDEINQVLGK